MVLTGGRHPTPSTTGPAAGCRARSSGRGTEPARTDAGIRVPGRPAADEPGAAARRRPQAGSRCPKKKGDENDAASEPAEGGPGGPTELESAKSWSACCGCGELPAGACSRVLPSVDVARAPRCPRAVLPAVVPRAAPAPDALNVLPLNVLRPASDSALGRQPAASRRREFDEHSDEAPGLAPARRSSGHSMARARPRRTACSAATR